jgi:hypothetical protein
LEEWRMDKIQEMMMDRVKEEVEYNDMLFDDAQFNNWVSLKMILDLSSPYQIDFEDETTEKLHFNPN